MKRIALAIAICFVAASALAAPPNPPLPKGAFDYKGVMGSDYRAMFPSLFPAGNDHLVLQIQNASTTIATWVSFGVINCGTGMSCTASGSTVTLTSTGSGIGYPSGSGLAVVSSGSAWGTTLAESNGTVVYGTGGAWTASSAPTISAANMTSFPTLNQNTTGTAGGLSGTPSITVNAITATTYNGGALSGTFSGAPTLSGNVAFTGTPTFSNLPTFPSAAQNLFLATPNGSSGSPTLRAIVAADVPTLNQNTTGSAAKWTTARLLAGNSVDGSANVAFANAFIVQGTADSGLSGAQFLGALATGIVKNTTTTGVLSIAIASDFPTLNQNTTGTAGGLSGTPSITVNALTATTINGAALSGTFTGAPTLSGNVAFTGTPTFSNVPTFPSTTQNFFFATPNGSSGSPSMRAIVSADIPTLNQNTTGTSGGLTGTPNITVGTINATSITGTGEGIFSAAGAASTPGLLVSGAPYTGGSTTTNFPQLYINDGTGPTTFSANGTEFGINTPSGFTGNLFDFHINGGASVAKLDYTGTLTVASCTGCGGTISGLTTGYIPQATGSSTIGNSNPILDNSISNANGLTYAGSAGLFASSYNTTSSNGGFSGPEGTGVNAGTPGLGTDIMYPDSTNHCWHANQNNVDVGCEVAGGTSSVTSGDIPSYTGTSPGQIGDSTVNISSGSIVVAAGKSIGSADSGTPNFTFGTNSGTFNGYLIDNKAPAASNAAFSLTGAPFTGGSGTSTYPLAYINGGTAPSTWSTAGTLLGFNAPSGFTGNFIDGHLNGGSSLFKIDYQGNLTVASCSGCGSVSLAFPITVSGTTNSGGIPYFSNATTLTASGALTSNAVVIGGGAGGAPTTISGDTTTTHALFATAGAPAFRAIAAGDLPTTLSSSTAITNAVLTSPALGTPSSGTLTNATGLPLSGVVSATGAIATIADGNNPLVINCALTSGTTCLTTGETTAATTSGAVEHQITTLTTTTAIPLQITQGAAGPGAANAPDVLKISAASAGGAATASAAGNIGAQIELLTGAGSAGGATTGNGGQGGNFIWTGGIGGAAGGSASNNGGNGSGLSFTTGGGGAAGSSGTSGNGGNALFTMGVGGTTGTAGSTGQFQITGTAPASQSGSTGLNVGTLFNVAGVTGGADSNATGTAGTGSVVSLNSGAGGAGTGTNAVGGAGANINLTAGNGGASLGTGINSNGGNIVITPGAAGSGGSGTAGKAGILQVAGPNAGFIGYQQGATNTVANTQIPANTIVDQAPTAVTAYTTTRPGVAASGIMMGANASAVITQSNSGDTSHALTQSSKTAAVTTFTLCAATAGTACGQAGQYRVSYNFWGSGTACSSVTAGSVGLNLTWTDENGQAHTTVSLPMYDQKAATTGILFNFNTALTTESAGGSFVISTNGTIIQAATTYTACSTGTGTYNLRMAVEQLQ